jgi:hypothetical protein
MSSPQFHSTCHLPKIWEAKMNKQRRNFVLHYAPDKKKKKKINSHSLPTESKGHAIGWKTQVRGVED